MPVTSSGESRNFDVDVTDLFQRDRSQKNSLQFKIGKRWNSAYINDFEMDSQKRDTTFAQMAWMHKQYFGTAQLDITLANRWGVSWFNGQGDDGPRMASSPTYRYSLQSIDATLVSPFHIADQPLTYMGSHAHRHRRTDRWHRRRSRRLRFYYSRMNATNGNYREGN